MTTLLLFVFWAIGAMVVYKIIDGDGDTFDSWYMLPFFVGMVTASWLSLAVLFAGLVALVAFACLWWVAGHVGDGLVWLMNKTMSFVNTII